MQVSQFTETEEFAIVGGGDARAFQIGNSAAAFKILSDTLYSDKIGAVSREVLCNAVDAHIAMGKTAVPIKVTLKEGELIIQDFGPGIPDDRMVEIYATYFGSTKREDNSQTGGFGLGSKSPFAYTEHFTVSSCHKGTRRVYALTVSDEETDGAPAIKLMATAPCGEFSGLTVTVPIETDDNWSFDQAIRKVVDQGGMNVEFNGEKLPIRDYAGLREHGICLREDGNEEGISILYGNVLYPLGDNPGIKDLRREMLAQVNNIHGMQVVLYAPPSSIGITPSRESISYNPRTLALLQRLLRKNIDGLKALRAKSMREAIRAEIERCGVTRANAYFWFERGSADDAEDPPFPVCGVEAMAKFIATGAVEERRIEHKTLFNELARIFGDKSKLLRGLNADVYRGHFYSGKWTSADVAKRQRIRFDPLTTFDEQYRYVTKRLMRMVGSDRWENLHFVPKRAGYSDTVGLARMARTRRKKNVAIETPMMLYITRTRDSAYLKATPGFYLIDPKIKDAEVEEIKAAAERFRFTVERLPDTRREKAPPKPKVVKPANTYAPLNLNGKRVYSRTLSYLHQLPTCTVANPAAYLTWEPNRSKELGEWAIQSHNGLTASLFDLINKTFPNTVLATGKREIEELDKAGVPRIEALVLAQLRGIAANSGLDGQIDAALIAADKGYRRYDDGKLIQQLFGALLGSGHRLRCAALGIPPTLPAAKIDAGKMWEIGRLLFKNPDLSRRAGQFKELKEHQDNVATHVEFEALQTQAEPDQKTETGQMLARFVAGKLNTKDVPHLKFFAHVINQSEISELSEPDKARLADMIETEISRLKPVLTDDNGDQV